MKAEQPTWLETFLLDQVRAAVIATDLEGIVTFWNHHAETLFGWSRDEAMGRSIGELLVPDDQLDLAGAIMTRVGEGHSWEGEMRLNRKDGTSLLTFVSDSPIIDPEKGLLGVVGISSDITERRRGELRIAAQYAISRILGEAQDLPNAAARILRVIADSLGWDVCALWVRDRTTNRLLCLRVTEPPRPAFTAFIEQTAATTLGFGEGLPGQVWKAGKPSWFEDVTQDINFARTDAAILADLHSAYGSPIIVGGEILGVIEAFSSEVRPADGDLLQVMAVVGSQIGQFVERKWAEAERARLLRLEQEARTEAEAAQARLSFLAEASRVLNRSLNYAEVLQSVGRLTVPRLADWCVFYAQEEGPAPRWVFFAHSDDRIEQILEGTSPTQRTAIDALLPVREVLDSGSPEVLGAISQPAEGDLSSREIDELAPKSAMVLPLVVGGRSRGALALMSSSDARRYGSEDLALAEDLSQRIAQAIDNARLYQERSHVARTLQRSLLPPELPRIPGVEIGARYRPAGEGNEVGGDFYDLFETRAGNWAVVIGDVCGKGPDAAALTGLVRHTIRAAAVAGHSPDQVLELTNKAILRQVSDSRFCTVACVELKLYEGGARMVLSCGGHPPPLILRSNGKVEKVDCEGTLLGVLDEPEMANHEQTLAPGDAFVLFTDGVTEAEGPEDEFGEQRLEELLEGCAGMSAPEIAETIERTIVDFQSDTPRDDVAIIALRIKA
ncbi:MAG: SpoIIE family protein phosphatase [Actinomycetota bacterium]|nr:SpoIIE family protein phosphatase [Actinomycetota bacterium]